MINSSLFKSTIGSVNGHEDTPEINDFYLAWNLFSSLRKEVIETQRIRAQSVGFKITFLSTTIGIIIASDAPTELLSIPAFSAIFFDILIISYSITIKRIGLYCRSYLEPILKESSKDWSHDLPLWEEFLKDCQKIEKPKLCPFGNLPLMGNIGLTSLAIFPAISVLLRNCELSLCLPIIIALVLLFTYDILLFLYPIKIIETDIKTAPQSGRFAKIFVSHTRHKM